MTNHQGAVRCVQFLHWLSVAMFRKFPNGKSSKGREARAYFWEMTNLAPASL